MRARAALTLAEGGEKDILRIVLLGMVDEKETTDFAARELFRASARRKEKAPGGHEKKLSGSFVCPTLYVVLVVVVGIFFWQFI